MRRMMFKVLLTVALLMPVQASLAQRPYGVDTSHWNGDIIASQWAQVYNAGYVFCWAKATEGVNFTDSEFLDSMSRGASAGLYMGMYHFARPTWNTAVAEADYFVNVAGAYMSNGYLRPVLDLEDGSSLGATALSNWANAFINRVVQLKGIEPIIYTNTNYATYYLNSTVANRTLWIAQYFTTPCPQTCNPSIGVFNNWVFWQYSDHGTVPGLPGSTDVNVHNGTTATLPNYVIGGGAPPPITYICESRSGGQNYAQYSETGTWSSGTSKSTAAGVTGGIGHRWCTINSTAKTAVFKFTPTTAGTYEVFTTNCTTSNSGNPMIHKVTHAGGTTNVGVCQNTTCGTNAVNVWYSLGTFTLNSGTQYSVTLDGSTGGGSSPANNAGRSDAIKWLYTGASQSPTITRSPSTLSPSCSQGQNAANQTFTVKNTGAGTLSYSITDNVSWLSCSPTSGTSTGETDTITVTYSTSGLSAGTHNATITISDPNATNNPQTLAVTLTVSSAPVTYIVESRSGGWNYAQYSEVGAWANASGKSTAAGLTAGIGHRYCTIGAVDRRAIFKFTPTVTGSYNVYTTNCTTDNSANPMIHKITHAGGTASVGKCQNTSCGTNAVNKWLLLGTYTLNAGTQYTVTMDGNTASGTLPSGYAGRADAIKWEKP